MTLGLETILLDGMGKLRTIGAGSAMRSRVLNEPPERLNRRARALALRYGGIALAQHDERVRGPLSSEYEEDLFEALAFASLAVGAGIDHLVLNIEKRQPPAPDLYVTLTDGTAVQVEVGRILAHESGRHGGEIAAINQGLIRAAQRDPSLVAHVSGNHISFRMRDVPTKSDRMALVAEMVGMLRGMRFESGSRLRYVNPDPAIEPILHRLGVRVAIMAGGSTYVAASSTAPLGHPKSAVATFQETLDAKNRRRYVSTGALWLAMPLEDDIQVPSLALDAIRANRPATLGQFETVIVGWLDDAELIGNRP